MHRILAWEEQAILELIEQWGWVDRSHRKLAHRGSYTGAVFVSPSTLLRVALKHQVELPGEPLRARPAKPALPELPWERNRIWIWDATHFTRARRVAYAIVDVVTRYWIGYRSQSSRPPRRPSCCSPTRSQTKACSPPTARGGTDDGPTSSRGLTTAPR